MSISVRYWLYITSSKWEKTAKNIHEYCIGFLQIIIIFKMQFDSDSTCYLLHLLHIAEIIDQKIYELCKSEQNY